MRKIATLISILAACATSLSAITREDADNIVLSYAQSKAVQPCTLYVNVNEPGDAGISFTTSNDESVKAKYACWAYYMKEEGLSLLRYLFVKESNGSLLEVIANNDLGPVESAAWIAMDTQTGLTEKDSGAKLLYPNPVGDLLTIPCNGEQALVEIYDLKGARLYAGALSGKDACRLDVSFLSAGVYIVKVSGETYKIIKK